MRELELLEVEGEVLTGPKDCTGELEEVEDCWEWCLILEIAVRKSD